MVRNKRINKVIILAGGKGTRISEYSKTIPKPMIEVGGIPIIVHIIRIYKKYGLKNFYLALGYKGNYFKKYFTKQKLKKLSLENINLNFINTGVNTMTGGRLKKFSKYIDDDEDFLFTYGDGVSNININKLIKFHLTNKKILTVTAVKPPARFGALNINGNIVSYFKEKSQSDEGWINGGFFVANKKTLKFIKGDNTFFEREPMESIARKKNLVAYKHDKFWQSMDTTRDKEYLDKLFKKKSFFLNKLI